METLKEKTAKGLLWGGVSNGIQQLLNLAFGIFLARLLTQADYGMVGLLTVFSSIASALQEGGFISALNRKKEVRPEDYNAVFWFNATCSVAIYAVLYMVAPFIADFYNEPQLTPLARYLFLGFVISSLNIVPRAMMFRNLMVKESNLITLIALTVSGIVGVTMAANGFAYWGIATQTIVFVSMITLLSYAYTRWHPSLHFSIQPIRDMIGFSSKLVVTNVFTIINQNLFANLIGKFYSVSEVGNFSQANKWNQMGHTFVNSMLTGVAQPVFAKVDEDRERQLRVFRKLLRFTAFISFPAMFGLSLASQEVIVIAITEKWLASAHILSVLCIWGAFVPINNLFANLIITRGHSNVYMWCTIALCLMLLGAVIGAYPLGFEWMLRAFVGINIGWLLVWWWFVHREIGLRFLDMLRDISPYLLLSAALTIGCHYLLAGVQNIYLSLLLKVVIVGTLYVAILWIAGSVILKESVGYLFNKKRKEAA
ncbi:MAG: lipopolysaccharide biosynthesis protein [Bacteroidaceae bacterium]|nr:lipopolysaccharide biosynthesis protein [Bacteroidaceae bacterium]